MLSIILIILIINKIVLLYKLYIKNLDYLKYRFIFKKLCFLIFERFQYFKLFLIILIYGYQI